ncbi:MAG: sigma 54-interacting transcriptional regulator [Bradymonadia bacterium]
MRAQDLNHSDLLELAREGGVLRFAGQRALLLDAISMGLLRKYLVENFGVTAARVVLTQFGFAHGWRLAEALGADFKWSSEEEWRLAGPRIHSLGGLFRAERGQENPLGPTGALLVESYEAEQHLLHFGQSDAAVCWTICGLMSGYMSRVEGHEVFVLEDRCAGRGHVACHMIGRTREAWGHERDDELAFFVARRLKESLEVSLQQLTESLKAAELKLRARTRALTRVHPTPILRDGLVAQSPRMQQVVDLARRVARVDATVLITGESGSGKERVARLVHDESTRARGPFIAINCGAITDTLLESELFGHARGAFTGATSDRPGLFEAANGGTLLLDEVGEVSPAMQVKLLRVLQEREVRRVGENKTRKVDVRVVAATNRDLVHGVAGGEFRQDLYYRLKVVELHVPALRERLDDILPLARVLLADAALRMKHKVTGLSPAAADQLLRYTWPGNVRELANSMERAVALARSARVELEDLPEEVRQAAPRPIAVTGHVLALDEVEKQYILSVLALNEGNQTRTAQQLEIGTATLYRKLKSYGRLPPVS